MSRIHGSRAIIAGTISNASVANDAAIADIKLGTIATANKVNVSAIFGVLSAAKGGTGVDNSGKTITLGGNVNLSSAFSTTGSFTTTLNQQANVVLNLPSINGTIATEEYVDALAQSLDPKASVRAASQAALPAVTYANGTAGLGATLTADANGALPAQDGITLVAGDRLLVKNQAAAIQNGIYTVTAAGDAGSAFVLTRATDCDGTPANEVSGGMFTFVEQGTVSGGHGYVLIFDGNAAIGTDALNFTQFSGAGQLIGGNGISIDGNTVNIDASYWDDIQQINSWNVAGVTGMTQAQMQKLADLTPTAAEINELAGSGCVNADFVKLHNITVSAVQLSDVATLTRLASTASGDGASIIGLEAIAGMSAATVQAAIAELNSGLGTANTDLQAAIDAEEAARIAGDAAVTSAFQAADAAVTSAFQAADATLQAAIDAEETARIAAVSAEATAREAADLALAGDIADEATARGAAITAVTSGYQAADSALQDQIDLIAGGAAGSLQDEIDRATNAEITLQDNIDNEASTRELADNDLSARLDSLEGGAIAIVDYEEVGFGDGSQVLYTVGNAAFIAGTLKVWVNGLLMKKGSGAEEVQETTPGSGTFTFGTAPAANDFIIVAYR